MMQLQLFQQDSDRCRPVRYIHAIPQTSIQPPACISVRHAPNVNARYGILTHQPCTRNVHLISQTAAALPMKLGQIAAEIPCKGHRALTAQCPRPAHSSGMHARMHCPRWQQAFNQDAPPDFVRQDMKSSKAGNLTATLAFPVPVQSRQDLRIPVIYLDPLPWQA